MPQTPPGEPDYAFGQAMLTLRNSLGLTQAGLAHELGISRHAVGAWETGTKYPSAAHLKHLIALAVTHAAFTPGRESEEIRALWRAAHQKVLLSEAWLAALLRAPQPIASPLLAPPIPGWHVDWGEAPAVPAFYGREWELSLLTEWLVVDRCRVVSVLGLGGIGKSALVVTLMHQLAAQFDVVIWRSLRDAPTCEALLDNCMQVLAPAAFSQEPATFDARLSLLLDHLRRQRVLLVLDNLESVLAEGAASGELRPGYEGYGRLLRRVGETEHHSCLVFTSREKPGELLAQEGGEGPVRTLRLARLAPAACARLLADRQVQGTEAEQTQLIEAYAGNPLALKIVAQTIVDLFAAAISPFLAHGALIYGGVRDVLAQQFNRLSALEQSLLCWLAILREPVTLDALLAALVTPVPQAVLLEALEALYRRSLLERGQAPGSLTLQSVVLEYVTARLVTEVGDEIQTGTLARLIEHGLVRAQAPEYVRQTQERLLVGPLLAHLHGMYTALAGVEERLLTLLDALRTRPAPAQGYGPANLIALLQRQRGDLRRVDLSRLALRGVYLQDVAMEDASLAGAVIRESVFTETFAGILSVVLSADGHYLAASSWQGDIRLWSAADYTLQQLWADRADAYFGLAISPDGRLLAAGSWLGVVSVWNLADGRLRWSAHWHKDKINQVLFTPDSRLLISCDDFASVRLWDAQTGAQLQILPHPTTPHQVAIPVIACSPDGRLLASADEVGRIYLWALAGREPARLERTLTEHDKVVTGLAFTPDGRMLASASWDGMVKLWEVPAGRLHETLLGARGPVSRVAWSPDGRLLACGGHDQQIWLWDVGVGDYRAVLRGHTGHLRGLVFTPDGRRLISGSFDSTIRAWAVPSGQSLHVIHGHIASIDMIIWRPDGTQILSLTSGTELTIHNVTGDSPSRVLAAAVLEFLGMSWSPDGRRVVTSDLEGVIRIWDAQTGAGQEVLRHPDDADNIFQILEWSPDGRWLATGTRAHGVLLWDMRTPHQRPVHQLAALGEQVAWSPDGTRLAVADSADHAVVWNARNGSLRQFGPHRGRIERVVWSPGGRLLVSSSGDTEGALLVWDVERGTCLRAITEQVGIRSVADWGSSEDEIISGARDGTLRWWRVSSGECVRRREAHAGMVRDVRCSPDRTLLASCSMDEAIRLWDARTGEPVRTLRRDRPYERMNITGIQGLTAAQQATLRALGAIEDAPT